MDLMAASADVIFMPVHLWSGLQNVLGSMETGVIYLLLIRKLKHANIASYICHCFDVSTYTLQWEYLGMSLSTRRSGQKHS
jgi:hypothetical protein